VMRLVKMPEVFVMDGSDMQLKAVVVEMKRMRRRNWCMLLLR